MPIIYDSRWLDTVPVSRVIARCTQDTRAIDGPFANTLATVMDLMMFMMFRLAGVLFVAPIFILPTAIVSLFGVVCAQIYIEGQRSIKREAHPSFVISHDWNSISIGELSNARSPVVGHFGAATAGLGEDFERPHRHHTDGI
jgi:hypothetical protein